LSSYDIAKQLEWTEWEVSADTIQDIIKDLPQLTAQSEKWAKILNTMDEIISEIADITRLAINPIRNKVNDWTLTVSDLKQLNDIAKNNFDRKQILTGKPTDITKHEWLSTLSTEELLKITNW
jgi:hypothetical protein